MSALLQNLKRRLTRTQDIHPRIIIRDNNYGDPESEMDVYSLPNSPYKKAKLPTWYMNSGHGWPRMDDIATFRQLAEMGIVQRCIKKNLDRLLGTDWGIIAKDKEDKSPETKAKIKEITDFLDNVNDNERSYFHELRIAYTDKLEIGEGVMVKAFNKSAYIHVGNGQKVVLKDMDAQLLEIQSYDASQFYVYEDNFGRLMGHWQFNFVEKPPQFFSKRELIVFQDQSVSYRRYGRSRIRQVQDMLEMVFYWALHMKNFYKQGALMQGFIKTMNMSDDEQKDLETFVKDKFRTMKHKLGIFHGGKDSDISFVPMMLNVEDIAFLNGLDFIQRFVASVYEITPTSLGLKEINRATAGEQTNDYEKIAKTDLMEIEYRTNHEVVQELDPEGLVEFKFIQETDTNIKKIEQEIIDSKIDRNIVTINEVRREMGLDPVDWGEKPMAVQQMEQMQQQFQTNQDNPKIEGNEPKLLGEGDKKKDKGINNDDKDVDKSISDVIKDHDTDKKKEDRQRDKNLDTVFNPLISELFRLLIEIFGTWENKIIKLLDIEGINTNNLVDETIDIDAFAKTISDIMIKAFQIGLKLDDNGLLIDTNIFGLPDKRVLDYFNSYPLIIAERKGSSIAGNLKYHITEGVTKGEAISKISKRIKDQFKNLKTYEADRIARTEIINASSWGKITQLRTLGKTSWQYYATLDERTDPLCNQHHEKIYDIDNLEFKPPLHPNCRCVILSTVGFDINKAFIASAKMAIIELTGGNSIKSILKSYNGKSVRDIAYDLSGIVKVSYQTVSNWISAIV